LCCYISPFPRFAMCKFWSLEHRLSS
jgi:hypothetical protein